MGARKLEQLFLRCKHRDRFKGKLIDFSGGQIANATVNNKSENFTWDGLALLKRDATTYLNEPAVTGGNPVAANGSVMFNDMLGTTQGTVKDGKYSASKSSLFGEFAEQDKDKFFTGKPNIDGLGYSFLFRSYRPELAKWQTSDPLGYPDGFNNFAYLNNQPGEHIDQLGLCELKTVTSSNGYAGSPVTTYQYWDHGDCTITSTENKIKNTPYTWTNISCTLKCGQTGTGTLSAQPRNVTAPAISFSYAGFTIILPSFNGTVVTTAFEGIKAPCCANHDKVHKEKGTVTYAVQERVMHTYTLTTWSCGTAFQSNTTSTADFSYDKKQSTTCVIE